MGPWQPCTDYRSRKRLSKNQGCRPNLWVDPPGPTLSLPHKPPVGTIPVPPKPCMSICSRRYMRQVLTWGRRPRRKTNGKHKVNTVQE